ncbi:uncharacterized protein LOC100377139 [Saccoglossus kowalevskii]|uniref:4-coumarate--CoA ligase 1-like isoform X1 n=1 Tax=Saccoglossus kowalevskii TaxID=10224 RepID=A0ABM0MPH3_SACKO|nr:PREDICTED: 4-coumarate--CoA ligase 1-like isoform X1 [Saccoglossus kowalevskii]XP_006821914.1 PREDICTED: 4-coumarate--CoA ligase 1-like isoform X2 [Saccoglossus kowalevskii]
MALVLRRCWPVCSRGVTSYPGRILGSQSYSHTRTKNNKLFMKCTSSRGFSKTAITSSVGILKSKYPDFDIPTNLSLPQFVLADFDKRGDAVALVNGFTDRSYTFKQLKNAIHNSASGLSRDGFRQGDVCAIFSPNIPEFFIAFNAVASIGAINTTVNPLYTVDELANQLNDSESKCIITIPQFADKAREAAEKCSNIKAIYVFGTEATDGCIPFTKLMEDDGSAFPSNISINPMEDLVVLPYSSGTTGEPKGVMLSHYNLISNITQLSYPGLFKYKPDVDCLLGLPPYFHIYGMTMLQSGLWQGVKHVTLPKFEPEEFLRIIQDYKITCAPIVPPIVLFLAKHPSVDNYDLSSLKEILSGAAPLGAKIVHAVKDRLDNNDLKCRQGFGLTELSPVVNIGNLLEDCHPGSVGQLVPNTEAKVVDVKTGEILGKRQNGELCYRGPQMMKGYLKNEKATADTIKDGWLHTGDIGFYDNDGQFYVVDRLKELIKYKGFQVAPAEIEALLLTHTDIKDACVIGIPDEEAGELPKAFVVANSSTVNPKDILSFVESKVAPHKRLRGGIEFVNEIPKTASGKILRRNLRDI